MVDSKAREGVS